MAALLLVLMAVFLMPENEAPVPATDQQVRTLPFISTPPINGGPPTAFIAPTNGETPSTTIDHPTPGRE